MLIYQDTEDRGGRDTGLRDGASDRPAGGLRDDHHWRVCHPTPSLRPHTGPHLVKLRLRADADADATAIAAVNPNPTTSTSSFALPKPTSTSAC